MPLPLITRKLVEEFALWEKMENQRGCKSFTLEVTSRCNNNCRHCYINLPAEDARARQKELSTEQILDIADQAVRLGAVWCNITGGEPSASIKFRRDLSRPQEKRASGICHDQCDPDQ